MVDVHDILALKMSHASTVIMHDSQKPQNFEDKVNTQQRCVNFVNHLDRIRVLAILCPVKSKVPLRPGCSNPGHQSILLSLLSSTFACVVHWCFFFAHPSSLLLPRFILSALLSLPPFPLPLRPRQPRSRFSLPLLPPPPFVPALLGHALKHLVSTRACCYVLGRAHTFILLLSFLPPLCSRALFLSTSLPFLHALCVAFAYFVTSPLLFVWGTHTSSCSCACNLPPSSSDSFCSLAARYLCVSPRVDTVGNATANSPLAFRRRCTPLGFLCAFMSYAIWSLRCGLFVICDAQE